MSICVLANKMYTSYCGNNFTIANRSLNYHSPNLFPIPLNLQDMVDPLHTTWRYSDLIAVVYMLIKLTHDNSSMCFGGPFTNRFWVLTIHRKLTDTFKDKSLTELKVLLTDDNDW